MAPIHIYIVSLPVVTSLVSLLNWTEFISVKQKSLVLMGENQPGLPDLALEQFFAFPDTIALVGILVRDLLILIAVSLMICFFEVGMTEVQELVQQLVKYVIYQGIFLPFVVPSTRGQARLWSMWLIMVSSLKMYEGVARDILHQLNASRSTTHSEFFSIYCVLLVVITVDAGWIRICYLIYQMAPSAMSLLLFFVPLSIASETLQGILVHGIQRLDMRLYHSVNNTTNTNRSKLLNMLVAGLKWERKHAMLRNVGFFLEIMTFFMALGHYVQIWRLNGMPSVMLFVWLLKCSVEAYRRFIELKNISRQLL